MEKKSEKYPETKKRKPPWILGGLVLLFLISLVLLQSSNVWKNLEIESAGSTLLLYSLSSLNFFAFIVFGFIFIRSLLKLIRERRALLLGSQIKTRLLMYFAAISLLPIIAMAVFSYLFMNRAIERWFSDIPENVVRQAQKVEDQAVADQTEILKEIAQMLTTILDGQDIDDEKLDEIARAGNLTRIEVLSKEGKLLAESEKEINSAQKAELENELKFIRAGRFDEKTLSDGEGFDAAIGRFSDGRILIIVPNLRSAGNVSQIVDNALRQFDDLKETQNNVRQIGLLTLGVLTFLLIFASSWTAFYIAKGLTKPIKALAEGADEIARGNFSHRVEVLAEDELALLVSTFNQMSGKLEENSAQLSEGRKYIETVLQSLSTGVISFDAANRITTINKAAIEMLKLDDTDFSGLELEKLLSEENQAILQRLLNRAKRIGQASEQRELKPAFTNGNREIGVNLPVALTATALPGNFGKADGVVLVIEDLSELIAAQRASAWQEVARRMAHEIKNPLTPIQLSAERIAKRLVSENGEIENSIFKIADSKSENQTRKIIKDGTDTILREVDSLKAMVDEFSRYARLPDAQLESKNLNEIIRQTLKLYEDRFSDIEIEADLAERLPNAKIDEEQLKRVFVNLIDNAIEAFDKAQKNKKIELKTFYDKARDLIVAEVCDNGGGIAPSDFQKIFQPYFSTKGRETGLGLAIVQRIITEHRGKIRAVNSSTQGAKFIVELPTAL